MAIIRYASTKRQTSNHHFQTITMKVAFQTISKTHAIDHLHYRFYWESYVRNSTAFINEIGSKCSQDKYGIKIVYDNHQFHTSSWLNVERGTGFPIYLFNDSNALLV